MSDSQKDSALTHWKCLLACTLVSMCPFQYGIDFGIIGGLQAMPGFLQVNFPRSRLQNMGCLTIGRSSETKTLQ
jgi:hypothetical protein